MEKCVVPNQELEPWLRTFFVADEGEIYLPCGAFEEETSALLALAFDGRRFVMDDGHPYATVDWLSENYPRSSRTIEELEIQGRRLYEKASRKNSPT